MLPNSNEKAKSKDKQDVYIKSSNFSLLNNKIRRHARSQSSSSSSATSEGTNTFQSSFNLDKNTRGWIVEPSNINTTTGVQLTPSRSLDNRKQQRQQQQQKLSVVPASTNSNLKKPTMAGISQKDILGAVSDEDIFKLTELTSRLPEVTTSASNKPKRNHSRHRSELDENIARERNHSSSQDTINPVTQKVITSQAGIVNSTPSSSTPINNSSSRNSSDILLDNTTPESNSDTKRRSWLYKSLIKPKKKTSGSSKSKSASSSEEQPQEPIIPEKSPAASIVEEFYNRQSLENSLEYITPVPITRESSSNNSSTKKLSMPSLPRIHSINIASSSDVLKNKLKAKRLSGIRTNNNHARSNSSHVTGESSNTRSMNRRHSFDSFHSLLVHKNDDSDEDLDIEQDDGLLKWDQDRRRLTFNYAHEERPTFNLVVSTDNIHDEINHDFDPYYVEVQEYYNSEKEEEANNTGSSTPINYIDEDKAEEEKAKDDLVTLMFDYLSLPAEVKSLIDLYEQRGKVERKRMVIKHNGRRNSSKEVEDDEDDEDEEDDEEDEESIDNVVNFKDIISGQCLHRRPSLGKDVRDISIVTTARSDNTEFTKLVQVGIDGDNGPLLDLHVSFDQSDEETEEDDDLRETIQSVGKSLESFQAFKKESSAFLRDYMDTIDLCNHQQDIIPSLSRTHSYPNLSADKPASSNSSLSSSTSSSDGTANNLRPVRDTMAVKEAYSRNTQSMYANNTEIKSRDPFERKQKEIFTLVNHLKAELHKFKDSLEKTENLVNDVQSDMVDTRNRMDTYIKDIPETHYSALKKLEVDIESILSNRAKNPWLDTGYALLSYLLTLFALVVWIVIYILKWGKKVVLFPRNLWRAYKDYLEERNKVVRNASMMSVAGTGNVTSSSSSIIPPQDASLFQRSTSNRLPSRRE